MKFSGIKGRTLNFIPRENLKPCMCHGYQIANAQGIAKASYR